MTIDTTIGARASVSGFDTDPFDDAPALDLGVRRRSSWSHDTTVTPVSIRRLVVRFFLAGLPVLSAVIVIIAVASVRVGNRFGADEATRASNNAAAIVEQEVLTDDLLTGSPAAIAEVDDVVRRFVLRAPIAKVKIHDATGRVVYSNDARLVGRRFPLGAEELDVLAGRRAYQAEVTDLSKLENGLDTATGTWFEVYQTIHTPSGVPLLFESYVQYDAVRNTGRDLWRQFAPIAIGSLVVLELVQVPFAIGLARRLRSGQRQRERLLQHAIDSSDAERRRIAGDLHDGAVQELTGLSISLAAGARSPNSEPAEQRATLQEASGRLRNTVASLRSMLVDIYPPDLHETGLVAAIADLLGPLQQRGTATRLVVDGEPGEVHTDTVNLLYRSAQELLRNVAAHSHATEVMVRLSAGADDVRLEVRDDGLGFDGSDVADRGREGHLGLRALAALVNDAGGVLDVRSVRGAGTRVTVALPVAAG